MTTSTSSILPRTDDQRDRFLKRALPGVIVPERAVDGLSLIAAADLSSAPAAR